MERKRDEKQGAMTPKQAAHEIEPAANVTDEDDPREELGYDQPESSAQKLPEPTGPVRR